MKTDTKKTPNVPPDCFYGHNTAGEGELGAP